MLNTVREKVTCPLAIHTLTDASVFPNLPAADDLTAIYLLALAVKHSGRFATFDQSIDASLIPGGPAAILKL